MPNLSSKWKRGRINNSTGSITTPGSYWSYDSINLYTDVYIPVNGGETIVFTAPTDYAYTLFIHQYTTGKVFISQPTWRYIRNYNTESAGSTETTYTLGSTTKFIRLQFQCYFGSDSGDLYPAWFDTNKAQLEVGNKPTAWKQPYADTITSLNRTGIDIEQGKITLDAAKVVVTGDLFAKILNADGIQALAAKYGVTNFPIDK